MSTITVRLNKEEEEILKKTSKLFGIGVSSLLKKMTFEKLEDEYDLKLIQDYENSSENTYYTHEEMKKRYDL